MSSKKQKSVITLVLQHTGGIEYLQVLVSPACDPNRAFDIGIILEPMSDNPILQLDVPFGLQGLGQITPALEQWLANRYKKAN